jgi:hypothetical protein
MTCWSLLARFGAVRVLPVAYEGPVHGSARVPCFRWAGDTESNRVLKCGLFFQKLLKFDEIGFKNQGCSPKKTNTVHQKIGNVYRKIGVKIIFKHL